MTRRIVIPCREDRPEQRHRWQWRSVQYLRPGGAGIRDRWCERCGRWYIDVIEQPDERARRLA